MNRRDFLLQGVSALYSGLDANGFDKRPRAWPSWGSESALYGAAIAASDLLDSVKVSRIVQDCKILVPISEMKWRVIHPEQDKYDFSGADFIVEFSKNNDIAVRGHTLCWHLALPEWVTRAVRYNAQSVLLEHIESIVGRYEGSIHSWDVVNEVIDELSPRSDGLKESPWLTNVGDRYVDLAFFFARQFDKRARLIYNEYGIERDGRLARRKRSLVLKLLRRLKEDGVPIDGLGIQSHLRMGWQFSELPEFIDSVKSLGLSVYITELDVSSLTSLVLSGRVSILHAASTYSEFLRAVMGTCNIDVVLTWGLKNRFRLIGGDEYFAFLPFDDQMNPTAVRDAVRFGMSSYCGFLSRFPG